MREDSGYGFNLFNFTVEMVGSLGAIGEAS